MAEILTAYLAAKTTEALQQVIDAPALTFSTATREEFIDVLLKDLKSMGKGGGLQAKDARQALLALKTLGKIPTGSQGLATAGSISTLLGLREDEALRVVANTMLLHEVARGVVGAKVDTVISMMEKATSPDTVFVLSRIMFLCTVAPGTLIVSLVEEKRHGKTAVDVIASKLDVCMVNLLTGTKMSREAMSELLKFAFNLLMHYPKITEASSGPIGEVWNSKLDGILAPLLRVYNTLPTTGTPLEPPLTHLIHALITIPVTTAWFDSASSPTSLDRALHVLNAGRRSISISRSPSPAPLDVLQRTLDLIDVSFSHFFPETVDPDDITVRERPADGTVDDVLAPLVLLLTRLCADIPSRVRVRDALVPASLDRISPLEGRPDLLGRCLRVLGSVYHPRLKDSVGELLFVIADEDAAALSALVGYGNVAGFLFNRGVVSAPTPSSSAATSDGRIINPVTGTVMQEQQKQREELTEEEKEREMEKLFVLFDRLERTGAVPPSQNPVRQAIQRAST